MTYEAAIRERAERDGHDVEYEGDGIRVTNNSDPDRPLSCWHRLGGHAEDQHNRRHEQGADHPHLLERGRWVALKDTGVIWLPWADPRARLTAKYKEAGAS